MGELKLAFRDLEVEHPTLVREIGVFRADYEVERQATDQLQAAVDALEERKKGQKSKRKSLEDTLEQLEGLIGTLNTQHGPVTAELGNGQIRNSTQKKNLDVVNEEYDEYDRLLTALKDKKKKKKKGKD